MDKQMLQKEPVENREQILRDSCEKIEELQYHKQFTIEQLQEKKEKLSQQMVDLTNLENELELIKKDFKEKIKPIKQTISVLIEQINHQTEMVKEECFKFIDHDEKEVGFYNARGELVKQRPMLPDERQTSIFSINNESQTGTE